ncbi:hypothetical protein [Pedobacter sp. P26]|uniref:hypothetical protein n=1 Tax=Pedobacter sp. P26 TaxID=3423956 RepID=UPI003D6787E0
MRSDNPQPFSFESIDESRILVGNNADKSQIQNFIKHYFEQVSRNELLFSIVESTSLNDLKEIGETLIYSPFSDSEEIQIMKNYRQTINEIVEIFGSSVAEHPAWYKYRTQLLLHSNPTSGSKSRSMKFADDEESWWTFFKGEEKKPSKRESYKSQPDFKTYLHTYAEKLYKNLKLHEFPNICVIVKPMALKQSDMERSPKPIGNLYLLFCTRTAHPKEFYEDFLVKLFYVWIKCNWEILLREYKSEILATKVYYPRLPPKEMVINREKVFTKLGYPLLEAYDMYFKYAEEKEIDIAKKYDELFTALYEFLCEDEHAISNGLPKNISNLISLKQNTKNDVYGKFEVFSNFRMFALICNNIFGMNFAKIHVLSGLGNPSDDLLYRNLECELPSAYNYMQTDHKLLVGKKKLASKSESLQKKITEDVLNSVSIFEINQLLRSIDFFPAQCPKHLEGTDTKLDQLKERLQKIIDHAL